MAVTHNFKWVEAENVPSEITTQEGNGYELKGIIEGDGNTGLLFVKGSSGSSPFATSSGYSTFRNVSVSNSAIDVKGSAGNLFGWNLINPNGAEVFLKLYNATAANVTVGTTTPIETIRIPTNGSALQEINGIDQISFDTALSIAAVTEAGDTGTTAPTTAIIAHLKYA